MAEFVDLDENGAETIVEDQVTPEMEETVATEVEETPEKYKGKSMTDIIKMHQEAEKLIGRQGSEVGELRHFVDDFIQTQAKQQEATVEETDYFTDPQKAVQYQIDSHPAIKQAQQSAVAMKKAEVSSRLKSEHPDFEEIANDPSFGEWVQGSKVRAELYYRADASFDYDAANELLSTWKERKELSRKMVDVSALDRKQQLKAASTSVVSGSDEGAGKKIYRRADIMKLMQTDPDRYDSMQDEIYAAYRDKRVK